MVDRDYPALAWVPADASAAIAAAQLEDMVKLFREGADALLMLEGYRTGDVDGWMRARFGASPLVIDDLAAAGLNTGGSAAAFVRRRGLTFALPVADRARVASILDRHIPAIGAEPVTRGGFDGKVWRDGAMSAGYLASDEWVLFHIGSREPGLEWIDEILAVRGRGLGAEPAFARAKSRAAAINAAAARRFGWPAPKRVDVVGVLRPPALAADLLGPEPCAARAAAFAPIVLVGADVEWDRIAGFFELELADEVAVALGANRPPPPSTGMMKLVAAAPMSGVWTLPPSAIERVRALWQCDELDEPLDASLLRGATGAAGAAWAIDPGRPDKIQAVARVTGISPGVLTSMLDQIPGRSLLEKTRTISGVKLKVLGGSLGIPEIAYRIRAAETSIGTGAARVARALAGPAAEGVPLIHMRLVPAEVANLPSLLAQVTAQLLGSARTGRSLGVRLQRYQWGEMSLAHAGKTLRLTAAMQLARQQ